MFVLVRTAGQYARKLYLNVHMGKHNDVRPWKCKLCPAAFKYQCSLITHRSVHEGAFLLACIPTHSRSCSLFMLIFDTSA